MEEQLGMRVRRLRELCNWSQRELARRSGVSVAMLSAIERGQRNPTVRLAYDIAQAFGCSISALLEGPLGAALLDDPESGVRRESHANPLLHGRLEVVVYTLEAGAASGVMAPNQAGTLETVVVLDGELELRLDGEAQRLSAGSNFGHGVHATEYANPSADNRCRFLVLVDTSRC